ncbi:MAG: PaaI family thioesterase [Solirubrobacterales bacterium]
MSPTEALPPHQPNCLGCGDENPAGLGLKMRREGEQVVGSVHLDRRHEGAPGFVHGGAIATALDDALGMVLMVLERPAVTARLEVDFRAPARIDRSYELSAWAERTRGRKLELRATIRDGEASIAEAFGLFVEVDIEHFTSSGATLPGGWEQRTKRLPR